MWRFLYLALCMIPLAQCARAGTEKFQLTSIDSAPTRQDSVWIAVLNTHSSALLLVSDSTYGASRFGAADSTGLRAFSPFVADVDASLIADFVSRNASREEIDLARLRALQPSRSIALITLPELRSTRKDPDTGALRFDRYPGADGVMSLSKAGFDPTGRHALVHVKWNCGGRCGSTGLILLSRSLSGTWQIERSADGLTF
jgi:hypothetical protein